MNANKGTLVLIALQHDQGRLDKKAYKLFDGNYTSLVLSLGLVEQLLAMFDQFLGTLSKYFGKQIFLAAEVIMQQSLIDAA